MSKQEFLKQLEDQLRGQVTGQEVFDSVQYYDYYIEEEIRLGRSEEEVLDSLGSANSIAKSIIDAHGFEDKEEIIYDEREDGEERKKESAMKVFSFHGWKAWLTIGLTLVGLMLIFSLLFRAILLLIPFIFPMAVVGLVVHMFRAGR